MKFIYLRTNYWFNLKAGGSVGHTSGVINSLKNKVDLTVLSNEKLVEVDYPITIIEPVKLPLLHNEINELFYSIKIIFNVKKLSKMYKPDYVYHRFNSFSFSAPFFKKSKTILEYNSSDVWKLLNWNKGVGFIDRLIKYLILIFKLPIVFVVENYNLSRADYIIVVSEILKKSLISKGISENKILVNPNGVDLKKFHPLIHKDEIYNSLKLKGKFVLGFIGTFGQWHGIVHLAKAIVLFFENYKDENDEIRFLLIGNGKLYKTVKNIIVNAKLENKVIFTGLIPQHLAAQYLSCCDILLSPHIKNDDGSEFFGSPTKLFEYMAMCKPIIASDLNQLSEILTHKENAYLVEQRNIKELAEAMFLLYKDPYLREKISKKALEDVKDNYTWDKHVDRMLTFIN